MKVLLKVTKKTPFLFCTQKLRKTIFLFCTQKIRKTFFLVQKVSAKLVSALTNFSLKLVSYC